MYAMRSRSSLLDLKNHVLFRANLAFLELTSLLANLIDSDVDRDALSLSLFALSTQIIQVVSYQSSQLMRAINGTQEKLQGLRRNIVECMC